MASAYANVPRGSLLPPVVIEGITTPVKLESHVPASSSSSCSSSTSTDGKHQVGTATYDSAGTLPMYPTTASVTAVRQSGDHSWRHPSLAAVPSEAGGGLPFAMPLQATACKSSHPAALPVQAQAQHASHIQQVSALGPMSQAQNSLGAGPMNGHASAAMASNAMFMHQQLQLAHLQLQGAHAMGHPNGMLQINPQMPPHLLAQMGPASVHGLMQPQSTQSTQGPSKLAGGANSPVASDIQTSQRAAQLARYRHKRNVRLQALAMGDKKIRYQCRKTLADARPRVKGRFAKVHIDGLESVSGGSSPKASKANGQKGKLMKTVMSAVNLSYMQGAEHAMPKMDDLEDLNPMWWLNDSDDVSDKSSEMSTVPVLGDFSDDARRCYSENNLLQLGAFDVNAAMEVLQTENNFNAICSGIRAEPLV